MHDELSHPSTAHPIRGARAGSLAVHTPNDNNGICLRDLCAGRLFKGAQSGPIYADKSRQRVVDWSPYLASGKNLWRNRHLVGLFHGIRNHWRGLGQRDIYFKST